MSETTLDVRNDKDHRRYELFLENERVGEIDYEIRGNDIHLTHTGVDSDRRERGLASQFVQQVLQELRDETALRMVPDCTYIAHWLTKNEGYEELLTR